MTVTPWYKSHALWLTVITAIAGVLGGVFGPESTEVALFSTAAGAIVAYLFAKGIVVASALKAGAGLKLKAGEDAEEINF